MPGIAAEREDRGLSEFHPVRIRKAPEEIVLVLIDAFRAGIYEPGDLLPRERDLAERLGVSRVVVREAIEILRAEGIVETKRGRSGGNVVNSYETLSRLQASLLTETRSSLRAILEFRRPLELTSALTAARRASDPALAELEPLVEALADAIGRSLSEAINVDIRFHIGVAEATGNSLLTRTLASTLNELVFVRDYFPMGLMEADRAVEHQRDLFNAIRGREEDQIVAAVDRHLGELEDVLLGVRLDFGCLPKPSAEKSTT
jgi:DNA-binding FadR family transcriptional regulator